MQNNTKSTVVDWGQTPPSAPSVKRVDALAWVKASIFVGAIAGVLSLALVWRALPFGLQAPQGLLLEHMGYWAKLAARLVMRGAFGEEAKFYKAFWLGLNDAGRMAIIWRCGFGAWAALMPSVFLFGSYWEPRDSLIHLRGSQRHEGAEAVVAINQALAARVKRRPDHEIAPGVSYPSDMWTRHVLVVGGVGSGKSTAIKPLIEKVVASGEQLILFDPKSEFTMAFPSPAIIAPWDKRSLSWDVAKDMRNPLDMRRFAATMVRESQDPMWSNASRQLLVGLMIYLKSTRGADWGWRELAELVALPQSSLLPIMQKYHPEAIRAVEKASVTTAGILINLSSFCSTIFDLAEAWGEVPRARRVSFVDWTNGQSKYKQIILQGHGAYADLTKSYVEGIVAIVSAIVNSVEMKDDPSRKIWFIADEFSQMGKVPVRPLFEVGRSRGVRCVVACQDFAQLEEIYGASMVKAIVAMSGTLLVGQMMQGETAEQLCKAFGTREVERANMSTSVGGGGAMSNPANRSTTLSYNKDEVPLYKPSELSSRLGLTPDGSGVKLVLFTGGNAYELFLPHYPVRELRAGHVPAPWTRSVSAMEFGGSRSEGELITGEPANVPAMLANDHAERPAVSLVNVDVDGAETGTGTGTDTNCSLAVSIPLEGMSLATLPVEEFASVNRSSGDSSLAHEEVVAVRAALERSDGPSEPHAGATAEGRAARGLIDHEGAPLADALAEHAFDHADASGLGFLMSTINAMEAAGPDRRTPSQQVFMEPKVGSPRDAFAGPAPRQANIAALGKLAKQHAGGGR